MKVAFSVALLATFALAYSVFFHGGSKSCLVSKVATTAVSAKSCASGCCNKSADQSTSFVSTQDQDGETSCCSKGGSCCSKDGAQVTVSIAKQDGESSCCSKGESCCQKGDTQTVSVTKQDGECEGSCSKGGSCCQKGDTQTVSVTKQDGECEGSCSKGESCCQKGDTQTVSVAKQDGECSKCPASCQEGDCSKCPASATLVSTGAQDKCEAGKCQEGSTCCVAEAMKKLPAMTYKVGTESTCCAKSAAEMAEKTKTEIHYVVAGEEFCCKDKAYTALVEKTEAYVNEFVTPHTCEKSGATSLAGTSIACSTTAAKQTEVLVNATKDIKVGYQVGEESACCPNAAKALAEKHKAPIEYVVNGEKTKCELHARLMAAQAKYAAAVKAVSAASQASTEAKTETKTETKSEG
jgi:hypothetical protein